MAEITDEYILQLFANKKTKEQAFKLLLNKYQRFIYYNARRIVVSHEDANDVTQNVCLKIWRNLENFRGESALKTWISRICTNEALTFIEKKKKLLNLDDDSYTDFMVVTQAETNFISPSEIENLLQESIIKLPPKQRAVFTMRYYEEMPYAEMSEIFGTSESALKASYHFAVEKIKKNISERLTF